MKNLNKNKSQSKVTIPRVKSNNDENNGGKFFSILSIIIALCSLCLSFFVFTKNYNLLEENQRYQKFFNTSSYEFSFSKSYKEQKVKYDDIETIIDMPYPKVKINTGFIKKTTVIIYVNEKLYNVGDLNTGSGLREYAFDKGGDPHGFTTHPGYEPLILMQWNNIYEAPVSYYFVLIEDYSGRKELFLVNYVFDARGDSITFRSGEVYPAIKLLDYETVYENSLLQSFKDFDSLRKKLIEQQLMTK